MQASHFCRPCSTAFPSCPCSWQALGNAKASPGCQIAMSSPDALPYRAHDEHCPAELCQWHAEAVCIHVPLAQLFVRAADWLRLLFLVTTKLHSCIVKHEDPRYCISMHGSLIFNDCKLEDCKTEQPGWCSLPAGGRFNVEGGQLQVRCVDAQVGSRWSQAGTAFSFQPLPAWLHVLPC